MNIIMKYALAATMTGALALAAVTPGQARDGRNAAAAIGFGAGALVGAAVAGSNNGYYGPAYYSEPGYAYGPAYDDGYYAYEPAPVYVEPAQPYYYSGRSQRGTRNCSNSPASPNFGVAC
jgi:hypothetical protein